MAPLPNWMFYNMLNGYWLFVHILYNWKNLTHKDYEIKRNIHESTAR